MGQVAVGLGLQPHSVELGRDVALRAGLVQRSPTDLTQLGCDKERQNALEKNKNTQIT